jgi:hypothetical protein
LKAADGTDRAWEMGEVHTVKFWRKDDLKGIYEVWLDEERINDPVTGKPTFEVGALAGSSGRTVTLGFEIDADSGAAVDATIDAVTVTRTIR